jgi:hypothetical protein
MKYYFLFILSFLFSCSKKEIQVNPSLIGTWNSNNSIDYETKYMNIDNETISYFSSSKLSGISKIIDFKQIGNNYPYLITLTCKRKTHKSPKIVDITFTLKSEDSLYFSNSWFIKL